ncbi:MAG: pentapeptide repeat-containing protein [Gammaproteobacteria bacterium]|nr:pentapeptide repeat-containing protein [Gammaproteobacteria bacterium]
MMSLEPCQTSILELPPEVMENIAKHLSLNDAYSSRQVSKGFKVVGDINPSFQKRIWDKFSMQVEDPSIPMLKFFKQSPNTYRAIIDNNLKKFFVLLLDNLLEVKPDFEKQMGQDFYAIDNLKRRLEKVCQFVQLSAEIKLTPEDFSALGEEVVTSFRFLTQPIEDCSPENENIILKNVAELYKRGYTQNQGERLKASIKATFEFLRDKKCGEGLIYKNLAGANLENANLSGINLTGVNLVGAVLRGANLSNANLTGANLAGADLSKADLSSACLSRADLSGANLNGVDLVMVKLLCADLSGANLSAAYFSGVDLTNANLSGANLSGVNFNLAELSGANFSGANLSGANFCHPDFFSTRLIGADLSGANLDNAKIIINDEALRRDTHHGVVKYFISQIKYSIESNPAGILPLLLMMTKEVLNKIVPECASDLKILTQRCLTAMLEKMSSVEELNKLFSRVSVGDNIFCTEIYPEILKLVANTYLDKNLSCEAAEIENNFRTKLIEEISKQKIPQSFHTAGWDNLIAKIYKAELKQSQSFNSQSRANQM